MTTDIGSRIRECRKQTGLSADELAERVGVDRATIFRYERGDIDKVPVSVFRKIANALHVNPIDLMEGDDVIANIIPIRKHRIPLLGVIHAGEPTFAEESFECYVEVGAEIRADFALRVKGDSMINARIEDGDIVFIRKQNTVNDGEIAAVLIDEDAALKRVRFLPGGTVAFMAENPRYQPIYVGGDDETRNIRILGKAVAFQSDVR